MRITYTNKLSNMVAHYENLLTWHMHMIWYLKLNPNTRWSSGEECNQYHGQYLLAETLLSVTLNDTNSRSEVIPNLMKKSKITAALGRRTRHRQTWKTLFWEKGLYAKMVGNIMSIRQTNMHGTCVRATGMELYLHDFATTTNRGSSCS